MLGKSWLTSVFCTVICILKPGISVVICSKRKGQAKKLITKYILGELYTMSIALRKEIKEWQVNSQEISVTFKNGSKIEVVVSSEDSRGTRSNVIIIDEYRQVKEKIVNDVLLPFNTTPRQPGYLKNPKYSHLVEENKEIDKYVSLHINL